MEPACGVAAREPMIEELAAIVKEIDAAAADSERLKPFLSTLVDMPAGLFSAALLLMGNYGGGPFVLVAARNYNSQARRAWMRWPLRRLFTRMKPSRIVSPFGSGDMALAIPFSFSEQRFVVVAPLRRTVSSREYDGFFTVLESLTVPEAERSWPALPGIPATPMDPTIVGFALCDELYERIEAPLRHRGWRFQRVLTYGDLWRSLPDLTPDVIAVDAAELIDPLSAITSIHRAADSPALRIVVFADEPLAAQGAAPVVDRTLPHETSGEALFLAFKEVARESAVHRRARIADADASAKRLAATSLTLQELATFLAERAADIMHGWAHCALLNEYGAVSRAESPSLPRPVFSAIPKSFLSEAPFFELHVGERFLAELTDEPFERMAFEALKPLSGASFPIVVADGERRGVLVTCSRRRWADSTAFEALDRLARMAAGRLAELQPSRRTIPEFRQERLWERLRDRALGVDIYRSADCVTPWRYRALTATSGLLTLGLADDTGLHLQLAGSSATGEGVVARTLVRAAGHRPSFAATIDFSMQAMSYASIGFSPPVTLSRSGPTGSISSSGNVTAGVATLASAEGAVVCDAGLWRWLSGRGAGYNLRALLDEETPVGLASIVTLGSPKQ
ncbi:MAG: GAF domain-containing protein [Candidatus Eremiobacteraeota bacterium]|nr:GAF domain-containing protein [Candidatus Eremiobacteraeota bacterium]